MSKAVFIDEPGGPENFELREHDLPAPSGGQVRVRHSAIGLNFIDIYQRTGLYPISMPAILGKEAAGVIEAVGEGVEGLKAGDRVVHMGGGAYAGEANISAALTAKIPDGVSDEVAAAIFLKGLTVEMLVRQVFPLTQDDACLIHAAAGGVGVLLTQWAKHIGARVIAVVGNESKVAIAKDNGADDIIVRTMTDSIATDVRNLTGGLGVQVAYDSVGAATFEASLDSLAMRGHMVTYGNASGPVPAVAPLELSRRGSLTLTRPTLFHYATPDRLPAMAEALFDMAARGALKPKIGHTFKLAEVANAHRLLESGESTGAIILTP
ncbi:quinone oxidoreductase [Hyphococcus flavus]|uniref:Quinone oxidoreductase n=1 Tax=Hyphococcus flavus TaxID=1866326 RepID=A0AAF0CFT1_9PROT|nr:quinone oxidoreductase [Hyphococcus flavus]WDI32771.1 quinone oxidoreductase [Hyphococcus flavus]